jgi:ribose transport system ATP-binding protein
MNANADQNPASHEPSARDAVLLKAMTKSFSGVTVLDEVDLAVKAGSVHAVLGANGAGKSTLVKILGGYHHPDRGSRAWLWGEEVRWPMTDPEAHGIGIVHQDLGLAGNLSITENLAAGRTWRGAPGRTPLISWRREHREAARWLDLFGLQVSPRTPVSALSPPERALVAILRVLRRLQALGHEDVVLVLDEPTAYLPTRDASMLLHSLRNWISERGRSAIIVISHRVQEVLDHADFITVLRNGRVAAEFSTDEATNEQVVSAMIGEMPVTSDGIAPASITVAAANPILSVRQLAGSKVHDVTFDVRPGEVVGITALVGMGYDELPYLLSGMRRRLSGSVCVDVSEVNSPPAAIHAGLLLVPGDRDRDALWTGGTARENITIGHLGRYRRHGVMRRRIEIRGAEQLMANAKVTPIKPEMPIMAFSGGNRQKISIARTVACQPKVLLLHEPAQGIDAYARVQVAEVVAELAAGGCAVVMFTGDHEFIAQTCSRVLVLVDGTIRSELSSKQITLERIMLECEAGRAYTHFVAALDV